jgi:hypothetical protein
MLTISLKSSHRSNDAASHRPTVQTVEVGGDVVEGVNFDELSGCPACPMEAIPMDEDELSIQ